MYIDKGSGILVILAEQLKTIQEHLIQLRENADSYKRCSLPPSTDREVTQLAKAYKVPPKEYQEFLKLSNGWKNFWNGYHLIGSIGFEDELRYIKDQIWESYYKATKQYQINTNHKDEIKDWEMRTVQYYLPHYFIFGTDMKGNFLIFNYNNLSKNGLSEVILWNKDKGVIASFETFQHFVEYVSESVMNN